LSIARNTEYKDQKQNIYFHVVVEVSLANLK